MAPLPPPGVVAFPGRRTKSWLRRSLISRPGLPAILSCTGSHLSFSSWKSSARAIFALSRDCAILSMGRPSGHYVGPEKSWGRCPEAWHGGVLNEPDTLFRCTDPAANRVSVTQRAIPRREPASDMEVQYYHFSNCNRRLERHNYTVFRPSQPRRWAGRSTAWEKTAPQLQGGSFPYSVPLLCLPPPSPQTE